jgi:hypothetical protein
MLIETLLDFELLDILNAVQDREEGPHAERGTMEKWYAFKEEGFGSSGSSKERH